MINLSEEETIILENMLRKLNAEEQELTNKSEKPLVHHEDHEQLSLIIDGSGYAQKNDTVYNVKRGCLILLNKFDKHSFMAKDNNKLKILHLHTDKIYGEEDRNIDEVVSSKWLTI